MRAGAAPVSTVTKRAVPAQSGGARSVSTRFWGRIAAPLCITAWFGGRIGSLPAVIGFRQTNRVAVYPAFPIARFYQKPGAVLFYNFDARAG